MLYGPFDHNATSHTIVIVRLSSLHKRELNPLHSIDHTTDHHWTKNPKKKHLLVSGAQMLPNVGSVFKKML